MKIKEKLLEYLGVFIILSFCLFSIFLSLIEREVTHYQYKNLVRYAPYFENNFYDFRSRNQRNKDIIDQDQVLVKVDDNSLQKIGTWPLPRTTWASLLDKLNQYGAKVVAFDVLFPEKTLSCSNDLSHDTILKNSIESFQKKPGNSVILSYTTQDHEQVQVYKEIPEHLFEAVLDSKQSGDAEFSKRYVEKHTYPIEELLEATPSLGYINMLEDSDGVFRTYQLVANIDSLSIPSISLLAFQKLFEKEISININEVGSGHLDIDKKKLPLNGNGETKIRWLGSSENFYNIPLWKVLEAKADDQKMISLFKNKIVFIGSTATGAHDLRNTPVSPKMPGVYAHMNMIYMLAQKYFYKDTESSAGYTLLILLSSLSILLIVMRQGYASYDILSLISLIAFIYWLDQYHFLPYGYELKLAFTFLCLVLSYSWLTFSSFSKASREKKQIKGAFSRYVAPSIVDEMLSHPDKLKVGGERRDITCLFSDVRDFTSISEKLTPNDLAKCLNYYMGQMTDIVFHTSGTLDKYIGDAIVAFWGAPLKIEDHPTKAVQAAVDMIELMPQVNAHLTSLNYPEFSVGIGLNTGECNVGNMGSDEIFAYTALGDHMNLGARLESLCKYYGAQILISEYTYERLEKGQFKVRIADKVQVKGKEKGVVVYEVLDKFHPFYSNQEVFDLYDSMYQAFEKKDFQSAIESGELLLQRVPDDVISNQLMEKCLYFKENPPAQDSDHTLVIMTKK